MKPKMMFYAEREFRSNKIALYLIDETRIDAATAAQPITMAPVKEGVHVDPFARLAVEDAQRLIDELWHAGLRPSEGTGSAGAMAATERHLEDMRKLVFKEGGAP